MKFIEGSVAQALKPSDEVDLSAHRILIDLARTPTGKIIRSDRGRCCI